MFEIKAGPVLLWGCANILNRSIHQGGQEELKFAAPVAAIGADIGHYGHTK